MQTATSTTEANPNPLADIIEAHAEILKLGPMPRQATVEIGPDVAEWLKSNIPMVAGGVLGGPSLFGMKLVHRKEPGWKVIE